MKSNIFYNFILFCNKCEPYLIIPELNYSRAYAYMKYPDRIMFKNTLNMYISNRFQTSE
jgi:hypothetical protein